MKQKKSFYTVLQSATTKLTLSYLSVIMVMSLTSSTIFYVASVTELDQAPSASYRTKARDPDHVLDEWIGERAAEGRGALAARLGILNMVMFLGGVYLSYYLARRTLRPIERAMSDQDRFIADASHELRTPLTSLLLSNEIALRKKHLSEQDARHVIQQSIDDIKDLRELSDTLLALATRTPKALNPTTATLASIINDATKQIALPARAKNIAIIDKTVDRSIKTHAALLTKCIVILLDNAVKYSPPDTSITITNTTNGKSASISIKDEGYGIASSDVQHIFERFYRSDQSRTKTIGHGLGLSIASNYAQDLGGRLSVKSTLNKGSTFTIHFPLS